MRTLLASTLLLVPATPALAQDGPAPIPPGAEFLALPEVRHGDPATLAIALGRVLEADPASPMAEIVVDAVGFLLARPIPPDAASSVRVSLERFAGRPEATGFALRRARALLARLAADALDFEAARVHAAASGRLSSWRVTGPFGGMDPHDFHSAHPPEVFQDLTARMPGMLSYLPAIGPCRWTCLAAPESPPEGGPVSVAPVSIAVPGGIYYALADLHVPVAQDAVLWLAPGRVAVTLNGVCVATLDAGLARLGEVRLPVQLEAGWNRLLVKVQQPHIDVCLTGIDARPIDGLRVDIGDTLHPLPAAASPRSRAIPDDSLATCRRRLADATDDPWLRMLVALAEGFQGRPASALAPAEDALEAAPDDPFLAYHAARAWLNAPHVPEAHARDRARSLYQGILERDPDFHAARLALAAMLRDDGMHRDAVAALEEVLRRAPGHPEALRLHLETSLAQPGWQAQAIEDARRLLEVCPGDPRATDVLLGDAERLRNGPEVERRLREGARASREGLSSWIRYLQATSRPADALVEHDRMRPFAEDPIDWAVDHARLLHAAGRAEEAIATLEEALRDATSPTLLQAGGDLYLGWGEDARADEAYGRCLSMDPSQMTLRRRILLRQGREDLFWEPYVPDVAALLASAPGRESYPDASTLALLDQSIDRLEADGSMTRITHRLVKVLDDRGRDDLESLQIRGDVLVARTHRPDGSILEPIRIRGEDAFTMPGLEPGAAIEYMFREEQPGAWDASFDAGRFYFQDFRYQEPQLLSRYILLRPSGLPSPVTEVSLGRPGESYGYREETRDGLTVQIWEFRNQERPQEESNLPPPHETLPHLLIGSPTEWDDLVLPVAWPCFEGAIPSPILARWRDDLPGDAPAPPLARARRLYDALCERIQDGPVQDATHTVLTGRGDRLVVLKALLDLEGIPAEWVLARPRPEISEEGELPPRPQDGYYAIPLLLLRGTDGAPDTWIDGRWRPLPFGRLADDVAGSDAFVASPERVTPIPIPAPEPRAARAEIAIQIALSPDGRAAGTLVWSDHGTRGAAIKEGVRDADTPRRKLYLDQVLHAMLPGSRSVAADPSLPHLEEWSSPWEARIDLEIPSLLQPGPDGMPACPLPLPSPDLVRTLAQEPQRSRPLALPEEFRDDRAVIVLPSGWQPAGALPQACLVAPFGRFHLQTRWDPVARTLTIERRIDVIAQRVPPSEYPHFLRFARSVDEFCAATIPLRPAP